jgi:hypothetical protein
MKYFYIKLKLWGITDNVYMLLKLHLQNQYQRVIIKNGPLDKNESDWGLVQHGVPQETILGPLLSPLYINDLPLIINYQNTNVNPQTTIFVDDASIIVSNPNE